jgi:hypothetical protein
MRDETRLAQLVAMIGGRVIEDGEDVTSKLVTEQ